MNSTMITNSIRSLSSLKPGHRITHQQQLVSLLPSLNTPQHNLYTKSLQINKNNINQRRWVAASVPANSTSNGVLGQLEDSGWLEYTNKPIRNDYDAIMMLGGGLWENGALPPWVVRRLDGALHLYKQQEPRPGIVLILWLLSIVLLL